MNETPITRFLRMLVGLYFIGAMANITTGIINGAIDEVIPQVDEVSATLLSFFRFVFNFEGALIITIITILIWGLTKWKKSE